MRAEIEKLRDEMQEAADEISTREGHPAINWKYHFNNMAKRLNAILATERSAETSDPLAERIHTALIPYLDDAIMEDSPGDPKAAILKVLRGEE